MPDGRGERRARESAARSSTNWSRRDVERAQDAPRRRRAARRRARRRGAPRRAAILPAARERRRQPAERLPSTRRPRLQVRRRRRRRRRPRRRSACSGLERARLVECLVVPDDARLPAEVARRRSAGRRRRSRARCSRPAGSACRSRAPRRRDRLAAAAAGSRGSRPRRAGERVRDLLVDEERAVRRHLRPYVGLGSVNDFAAAGAREQRAPPRGRRGASGARARRVTGGRAPAGGWKLTCGASRSAASSTSKNSRLVKPSAPARARPGRPGSRC